MKRNVFIVNTEYHLILTLGIIQQYFSIGYDNIVFRVSPIEGSRLNNLDFEGTGIKYFEIIYDYQNPTKELKNNLQNIIELKPSALFVYLENKFWMNYLFSKLHQMGTRIILGPDGMKVYNNGCVPIKRRLYDLFYGIIYSGKTGLLPTWPHVEKAYATSKYIDEVWVEHPKFYSNTTNKKIVTFHYAVNNNFIELLKHVFKVDNKDMDMIQSNPSILFLDSSYHTDDYYKKTINILEAICCRHPERKVLIKYHPLSAEYAREKYKKLPNSYKLNSVYPAELYIATAKKSIVISMVSTSELFYNSGCDYYWIYKLYETYNYKGLLNPTTYIHVVDSVDEII